LSSNNRDLDFIGGGHAHALVLREFGVRPVADTRITLVSEQTLTPYSGMLPGFVAGHYSYLDTHQAGNRSRLPQWDFIIGYVGVEAQKPYRSEIYVAS